jgi:hypothetical protein
MDTSEQAMIKQCAELLRATLGHDVSAEKADKIVASVAAILEALL